MEALLKQHLENGRRHDALVKISENKAFPLPLVWFTQYPHCSTMKDFIHFGWKCKPTNDSLKQTQLDEN